MKIWFKNPTGDLWKLADTCRHLSYTGQYSYEQCLLKCKNIIWKWTAID